MYIHIQKTSGTNFTNNIIETYSENQYSNYTNTPPFGNINEKDYLKVVESSKKILYEEYNLFLSNLNENNIKIDDVCDNIICNEFSNRMSKLDLFKKILCIENLNSIKHLDLNFWQKNLVFKNHLVFSIVRNPYTRVVSYYHNINNNIKNNFNFNFTFKEFIKFKLINCLSDSFNFINYKKTQLNYLKNSSSEVVCDKFYKMESDMEKISYDFNLPNLNINKINCANYDRNYSKLFDDELIHWVQINYKEDFDFFGYDPNPFW